jgi:CheY-like chemotaxis protein
VETDNVRLLENHFHEVPAGDYVLLTVSDNGTGIPPAIKSRLFEPFFTTKEKGHGTGLGLATCMGIIKQSGGHISVYSEPGQGTSFKVYLPRVQETLETAPAEVESAPKVPTGSATVLLVEDEAMLRDLAELVLSDLGYAVHTAGNGREALEYVEAHPELNFDLVVTDVVMPEMGGRELAEHIRQLAPQTRVLFTSGFTEDVIIQTGKLADGIDFVQKPYSVDALAQKVHRILQVQMSSAA